MYRFSQKVVPMPQLFEASALRILRSDNETVGTGFLIAPNLAVTCAHVVIAAGAIDGDTIQVQFTDRDEKLSALVEPKWWRDVEKGDVAFLRLEFGLRGIEPLRLGLAMQSESGSEIRSFGYATVAGIQGIHVNGKVDGYLSQRQLLQFQSPQANHGVSGAPVLDEKRGVVVGMITQGQVELGRNSETTFATPTELLLEICSEIRASQNSPKQETGKGISQAAVNVVANGVDSIAVRADGQSTVVINRKRSQQTDPLPLQDRNESSSINSVGLNIIANQTGATAVDATNRSEVHIDDN